MPRLVVGFHAESDQGEEQKRSWILLKGKARDQHTPETTNNHLSTMLCYIIRKENDTIQY